MHIFPISKDKVYFFFKKKSQNLHKVGFTPSKKFVFSVVACEKITGNYSNRTTLDWYQLDLQNFCWLQYHSKIITIAAAHSLFFKKSLLIELFAKTLTFLPKVNF